MFLPCLKLCTIYLPSISWEIPACVEYVFVVSSARTRCAAAAGRRRSAACRDVRWKTRDAAVTCWTRRASSWTVGWGIERRTDSDDGKRVLLKTALIKNKSHRWEVLLAALKVVVRAAHARSCYDVTSCRGDHGYAEGRSAARYTRERPLI